MDIILQIIGLGFIPLLGMLVYSGIHEIYLGLKEHFSFKRIEVFEMPFRAKAIEIIENFGYRKLEINFNKG